ncbi:toxin-activating lysine-acyltransferase [Ottowia sp.]|uniref:toxin-activating lysine-acyltransferase n=1 Tax=Ottowia sp. TaxID=1898956 RepID=UPI0025E9AAB2|nr:toxin-activating lysine-acyltransferase [Ottowia sp.]MBK6616097.1 toxin-activating lysine-acyltransferase [Ottowia sp.]
MEVFLSESHRSKETSTILGHVVELLLQTSRSSFRMSSLKYWVKPAIELGQIKIFFDKSGTAVGFCTWAYVGDDLAAKLGSQDVLALHLSEWNEGLNLWFVDFVALNGYAFTIARWMKRNMFESFAAASGARGSAEDGSKRTFRFRRYPFGEERCKAADTTGKGAV